MEGLSRPGEAKQGGQGDSCWAWGPGRPLLWLRAPEPTTLGESSTAHQLDLGQVTCLSGMLTPICRMGLMAVGLTEGLNGSVGDGTQGKAS